jgi:hypothetical protein
MDLQFVQFYFFKDLDFELLEFNEKLSLKEEGFISVKKLHG